MHSTTYPFHIFRRMCYSFLLVIIAFSCSKEAGETHHPEIQFIRENGSILSDTSLKLGDKVQISFRADGGGSNITYFGVSMQDDTIHFVLDSGMNAPRLQYIQTIFKGNSRNETWTFTIMNRDRQVKKLSIILTKSESNSWGNIITYDPVILGAQLNPETGSFFAVSDGLVNNYSQAVADPAKVDIIYYYGNYEATFSSPMESEAPAYFPGLSTWAVKNETRYDTTSISSQQFNAVANDSLILSAYEQVNGKRKAKYLQPGMVISFRNQSGKAGLILVKQVVAGETGKLECAIKVQQ